MTTRWLACVALAACNTSGPTPWKDQPIHTVTGAIGGTTFTIALPLGMEPNKYPSTGEVEYSYHQTLDGSGYTFAPTISITKSATRDTLDAAYKAQTEIIAKTSRPPLRKETLPDGYVFAVTEDDPKREAYDVEVARALGAGAIVCRARVWAMRVDEAVPPLVPLVEAMCLSMTAK